MSDAFSINGNQISWGSLILKLDGQRYYGYSGISYGEKLETVFGYGMGRHQAPRGRSAGKYSTEPIKIKGPKSSFEALRQALARKSASGRSYGTVAFSGILQAVEPGEPSITVELSDMRWSESAANHEESADPLTEEHTFTCMKIRTNGLVMFDDSAGEP